MLENLARRLVKKGKEHPVVRYPLLVILAVLFGVSALLDWARAATKTLSPALRKAWRKTQTFAGTLKQEIAAARQGLPRRAMAVGLCLCMMLTLLPATALAVESAATPTEAITMDPTDIAGAMGEGASITEAMWGASADTLSISGTLVEAVTAANAATSGTTYIQLQKDVNTKAYLSFESGKTTVLDLNGKTINRGLTSSQAYGYVVKVAGNLTINDSSSPSTGKITGGNNSANTGGGLYVASGGSCTLTGGSISGNTATGGGGVSVNDGSFTMSGGSITGNTSSGTGGVSVRNGSTFHVSGGANISGNTSGGTASNVYLPDNTTITVTGALTGTIGVSTETAPIQGASVDVAVGKTSEPAYAITDSDATKFVSDNVLYSTSLSEGKVVLSNGVAIALEAEWTVGGETKTGTFAEALEAMKTSGGSMKLLTDVSTGAATTLPAKEISLDLGGKTWTSTDRTQIPRSGTLNLADTGTGGKILNTATPFTVETDGTLNLSGGTIENNSGASYSALSNSGTVTMSGGTIARSGHDVETVENEGTFSMSGGEITNAAYTGIENGGDLTMTGGSITATTSGVVNFGTRVTATITGGTIASTRGLGINNRSGSTLYLGGAASVTATAGSAVQNLGTLYLFGAPTLTKGTDTRAYQIYGDDDTIVASNGKAGGELAYYTGDALDIYFPSSFPANRALMSGIKDEAQSKKFNITIGGGNMMEPVYNDTAKTIIAKAKIYNITYKDRAKVTGGANFSGVHGTDAPTTYTAGIKATLVAPTKEGYTFGGWYERAWGSTDKAVTALKENPYGDKTFYAKWIPDTLTEKTAAPSLTRTIDAASWEGKVYFGLQAGSEYQEHVVYKLYTTADGNDMPDGITVKDEWGDSIKISSITTSTDYWLTATEDGKTESERVKISARAQYTGLDESGNLAITTPQQLADYLNYCEPGAATVSDTTVTLAKDVPLLYDIYFADDFGGALDLHGFTVTVYDEAAFRFYSPDAENVKFTLKGGGKVAAEDGLYAIAQEAGGVAIENATLIGGSVAILSAGGTLSLTDVTVKVPQTEVDDSATLYIAPDVKFTIHSGTFTNGNVDGYTYYGPPGSETPAKTLASSIPSGSTSVPANSTATDFGLGGDMYQICTAPITVTKDAPPAGGVTGVTLNRSVATLYSNPISTTTLTATVAPANATNKAVTWTSSTPSVATVDANGKVTAAQNGTSTITATTADGSFTATCAVTVKTLVTVTMADFVFGETPTTPTATADATITYNLGSGFGATAPTSATPAGTYTMKAEKDGSEATATFKILKAPVSFTVKNNVKTWTGGDLTADVTATPNIPRDITYRQNGTDVTPAAVGTYDIFAALISANHRHASGSDGAARKIGSFTILEAGKPAPTAYAVTFTNGGGTGSDPTQAETLADCSLTLPANPYTYVSHAFAGWSDGTKIHQPGSSFTMPAKAVAFTAVWAPTYTIGGDVKQGENFATGAAVTLMRGTTQIATTLAGADGAYSFADVPAGDYNLVATKDGVTKTILRTLKTGNVTDAQILLPEGKTNSVVEVKPGAPEIVVGGMEKAFDQVDNVYTTADAATVSSGGSVEFRLVVQETSPTAGDLEKIKNIQSADATLGLLLDLEVGKTSTTSGGDVTTTDVPVMNTLLESVIPLAPEMQGKAGYIIYRIHDDGTGDKADAITEYPNADGERLSLNAERNVLTLYAKKYSTYAIAYGDTALTPPTPPIDPPTPPIDGGGSSGGSGSDNSSPTYTPKLATVDHGSVTVSPQNPAKGDKVILAIKPDEGYQAGQITVTAQDGKTVPVTKNPDGSYSFIQPKGAVKITVTMELQKSAWNPFADVAASDWFHDGVQYAYENGLMEGTASGAFSPKQSTNRGMAATIFWRLAGSPEPKQAAAFPDVSSGADYAKAVAWAAEAGIVQGYDNGKFAADDLVTREQFTVMLWRKAGSPAHMEGQDLARFHDAASSSRYAVPALTWAHRQGILSGKSGDILDPQGTATRAEVAVMFQRFSAKTDQ